MALLCFRRLSRAKHFKCCVLPHHAQQSMPFTSEPKAPPREALHLQGVLCLLVFLKSSSGIYHFRLRFRRPSQAKHSIYCIFRFRRKYKCGTIVLSKAQPSKVLYLPCFRSFSLAKYGLAKYGMCCVSKTRRSKVSSLFMFPTA